MGETIRIDDTDSLLIHYKPDIDILHYNNSWNSGRFDVIHSEYFNPLSLDYNLIYFEVSLLSILTDCMKDNTLFIAVGLKCDDAKNQIRNEYKQINGGMLGWADGSIGFHSDDGQIFNEYHKNGATQTKIKCYGEEPNDVIGCGFDRKKKCVFFTQNGKFIQSEKIGFYRKPLSLCVVIRAKKEMVLSEKFTEKSEDENECLLRFNFGADPFLFDVE